MNCPACGQRNPSNASRCLHCSTAFEEQREGLFDMDVEKASNNFVWLFGGGIAVIVFGSMLLFGFDTYDGKCVQSESAAAELEAAPEWERNESEERGYWMRMDRRERDRKGRTNAKATRHFYQCYRKKTGHVDGIRE